MDYTCRIRPNFTEKLARAHGNRPCTAFTIESFDHMEQGGFWQSIQEEKETMGSHSRHADQIKWRA